MKKIQKSTRNSYDYYGNFGLHYVQYSNSYSNYQKKQVETILTLTQIPFLHRAPSKKVYFVARLNFGGLIL